MRTLYHAHGCKYIEVRRSDKSDCAQCQGSGVSRKYYDTCSQCNGHGWLWDVDGYAFKPYTLEPVYN
jgi:DnaJ-class molecular chaperone